MDQNLSDAERKQRLVIGLAIAVLAIVFRLQKLNDGYVIGLLIISGGFIFNYFTCYCGTKRMISRVRKKLDK